METLLWIIASTLFVSAISLVGIFSFMMGQKKLDKIIHLMIGFAAGALMGGAFLHLLPEAIEKNSFVTIGMYTLAGFSLFFFIERVLKWRHCHEGKCDVHTFTYMSLIGDAVHNFIDGLIMAASFIVSVPFGIVTTLAIIAHEVPQELGDFAVLLHGGFSKSKALMFNFITALTAVLGGIIGYVLTSKIGAMSNFLVPFAAGGFIYIAASDLVPELHKGDNIKRIIASFIFFATGILFMLATKLLFE